eukprot:4988286-Pleurochrysis_carterae.AAC.1
MRNGPWRRARWTRVASLLAGLVKLSDQAGLGQPHLHFEIRIGQSTRSWKPHGRMTWHTQQSRFYYIYDPADVHEQIIIIICNCMGQPDSHPGRAV